MIFERFNFKGGNLLVHFIAGSQSSFYETAHFAKIMAFVASKGKSVGLLMKQTNKELRLVADDVKGINGVKRVLVAVEAE